MKRPKPANILVYEGVSHKTKAELAERIAAEIHLGDKTFRVPLYITRDLVAMERWTECVEIFKDFDLVSSSDIGHLARYCKMYSEYRDLVERRATIANVDGVTLRDEHKAGEKLEIEMGEKAAAQLFKKIDYILSTSGVLEIDSAINKKADQLTKMEDRLFLNPQAKIKTQAQKKKPDKNNPLEDAGFGGI